MDETFDVGHHKIHPLNSNRCIDRLHFRQFTPHQHAAGLAVEEIESIVHGTINQRISLGRIHRRDVIEALFVVDFVAPLGSCLLYTSDAADE